MQYKTELSRENREHYVVVRGIVSGSEYGAKDFEMTHAETPHGHYIGDVNFATDICEKMGIAPELAKPAHRVCSIGFCLADSKWYGWSDRAIYGFTIGSKVRRGDCAYVPTDMEDARQDAIRFWSEGTHQNVTAVLTEDEDGKPCFNTQWLCADGAELVPNEKLRGQLSGYRSYPPEIFGKGEWEALTVEDAKQMAVDFAEGVS